MGLIYAEIELISSDDIALFRKGYIKEGEIKKLTVKALVDNGALMLCINENIKNQLNLSKVDEMNAELANGRIEKVDIVGPVDVRFKNRSTTCRAAVFPGDIEVLLGSIPMEDMDVILIPKEKTIDVNPESPYIAKKKMK